MSERWSSGQAKRPFPTNMAIWVSHFSVWMIERIIQWNEFLKTVEPHFCSCPFPNCYKTFLVHQRAWTCRYIPPLLLCSFATYLLHHLQCFDISGKVQHVSTLNESLSNCQRPEHLSFEVARWVVFQGFLAEGHSIFQTSLRYSRFKTIYRTDITPNKNWGRLGTRRKLRENLQKLSKDLGDAWGQWLKAEDGAPDVSRGEKTQGEWVFETFFDILLIC